MIYAETELEYELEARSRKGQTVHEFPIRVPDPICNNNNNNNNSDNNVFSIQAFIRYCSSVMK